MGLRVRILAIIWVSIGALGACGSGILLVSSLKAAHGAGVTGTFTLTEPLSCDRYQPPRQRCGRFGDCLSAEGRTARQHMELTGGLPPGAHAGDTVPARDVGGRTAVYQVGDTSSWRLPAGIFAAFFALRSQLGREPVDQDPPSLGCRQKAGPRWSVGDLSCTRS